MQLKFDDLFKRGREDWPAELDLSVLQQIEADLSRYTVKGLGQISDEISERYINDLDEIIMRNLHDAFFEVIHSSAKNILKLDSASIRPEAVRIIFERRLRSAVASKSLGWLPNEISLVESYFSQNNSL